MNTSQDPEQDRNLDKVLGQWAVDSPLPPRFQEQVWRRIALDESKPETTTTFWAGVWRLLETDFPRPRFAYSYVAILVLLGVISGALAAQRETNRLNSSLGTRYVQSVDPYQKVMVP